MNQPVIEQFQNIEQKIIQFDQLNSDERKTVSIEIANSLNNLAAALEFSGKSGRMSTVDKIDNLKNSVYRLFNCLNPDEIQRYQVLVNKDVHAVESSLASVFG